MALAVARGTLTFVVKPANNENVVIGSNTYVFKTTLTPTANEVLIQPTTAECMLALAHAVLEVRPLYQTLDYASATVIHPDVTVWPSGLTMFTHANVGGTGGNSIATTTTVTSATWTAATLTGGTN